MSCYFYYSLDVFFYLKIALRVEAYRTDFRGFSTDGEVTTVSALPYTDTALFKDLL